MSLLVNSGISSSLVRENVSSSNAVDIALRRIDMVNFLQSKGAFTKWNGGQPQQWNVVYATNSAAEVYAEGAAIGQPGKQSYARASLAPFYVRIPVGYSGHVADQVRQGGVYADPIQMELQKGTVDLLKKLDDTICGTTQDQGIQSVIDAGDTYAGLAPGTYTAHASIETSVGGALSLTVLEDNAETGALAMAVPTDILACQNQITNYLRLVGPSATTSLMRYAPGQSDAGNMLQGVPAWNGIPWTNIAGMTTTVVLMLDMGDPDSRVEFQVFRDITVEQLAKTSDDTQMVVSMAGALVCKRRRAHIKLTGVTA